MNTLTTLPTTLHARKALVTQMLTARNPQWGWMERIAHICAAHARLDAGVTVGRVLAAERKAWHAPVRD